MASIHKIEPKDTLRVFHNDVVIYWRKTGTICKAYPKFIKVNGTWCEYDERNEAHVNKLIEVESKVELAKVIPITGNKKQ